MRAFKVAMLCATALVAVTRIASAADMGLPAPVYKSPAPPLVVNNWTGFYLGGHAGWGWGHDPFSDGFRGEDCDITGVCVIPPVSLSGIHSNGFIAGFQAGYNQQWANWVGGLEIDLSGANITGSTSTSATNAVTFDSETPVTGTHAATMQDKFELLGSARARVGYLILPDLLFYGTGGLAFTRFTQSTTETLSETAPPGSCCSSSETFSNSTPSWRFGWAAGVGGEYRLWGSNWLARVEYLHYDFGNSGSFSSTQTFEGVSSNNGGGFTSGHLTVDVVRGGLSYKFGGPY